MFRRTVGPVVLVALVAVLAQLAFTLPADARPGGFGSARFAPQQSGFTLKFGDNVDKTWDGFLRQGANEWNRSKAVNASVVGGKAGPGCAVTRGQAEVCDDQFGPTGWLGLTEIFFENGEIIAARVLMNDTYFDAGQYDDPDAMRHTMTHEMGHAYGLPHAGGKAVMNDSARAIFAFDTVTGNDYQRLAQLYRGGGRSSNADADAGTTARGDSFTDEELNRPPLTAAEIGGDEKVEDLGDGKTRITIITTPDA